MRPRNNYTSLELRLFTVERLEAESLWALFRPMRMRPVRGPVCPQYAELYCTNESPRDRMRHDYWYRGERNPTHLYSRIDRRNN